MGFSISGNLATCDWRWLAAITAVSVDSFWRGGERVISRAGVACSVKYRRSQEGIRDSRVLWSTQSEDKADGYHRGGVKCEIAGLGLVGRFAIELVAR